MKEAAIDIIIKNVLEESQSGYRRIQTPEVTYTDIINALKDQFPGIHVDMKSGLDGNNKVFEVSGIGDGKLEPIEINQVKLKPEDNKYYVIDDTVDSYPANK